MNKKFKFSIVIAVYNAEDYLEETVNSIINQDLGFEENVQLILVDDGSSDNSGEIALSYQKIYPNNVIAVSKENGGQSSARNLGLKYAEGEYINFLDSDDKLSEGSLREIYSFFKNHDVNIIAIPLVFFDRITGDHTLNEKFICDKVVDVYKEFDYPQLSIASCFIKTSLFDNFSFDERFNIGEDAVLINKLLVNEGKIGFVNDAQYLYRKRSDASSTIDSINIKKEFYLDKSRYFHVELINYCLEKLNYVPKFVQYVIAHDMQWYYNGLDIWDILTKEEYDVLMDEIHYVLGYIDKSIILNHNYMTKDQMDFLIYLKNNNDFSIKVPNKKKLIFMSGDQVINRVHKHTLNIDIVELTGGFMNISGYFVSYCDDVTLSIEAIKKVGDTKEIYKSKYVEYPTTHRHLNTSIGIPWKFYYNLDFKIPVDENENCKISFFINYNENDKSVKFYPKLKLVDYCNLSEYSNYFVKDNKIVLFTDNSFHIVDFSSKFRFKLETLSLFKILTSLEPYDIYAIFMHLLNLCVYPLWKNRKIWLFIDRRDFADDNAKHLFKYAVSQNDGIEKYFIVDKKSKDYKTIKSISSKNVVNFGSIKHKLLYFYAEKIISSHINHEWLNPFHFTNKILFSGLTTHKRYFLQHGVTKDDVSRYLVKYLHNMHLFLTLSKYEYDSIVNGHYNYDENVVQCLGFPRYDNLKNEGNKKQILFIPTWRSYINEDNFYSSEYFLRIKSLLENERLSDLLQRNNYEIIFKPHQNLLPYMGLFNVSDEIKVDYNSPYQELFNNSSLMITDYSSVFFDFAYIKKPVIYYQNEDYHYEKGYFDYETMGFGEVIESEEELITQIEHYVENNCEMEEKYQKRVDDFFKYTDKNNCKRVYEWILEDD